MIVISPKNGEWCDGSGGGQQWVAGFRFKVLQIVRIFFPFSNAKQLIFLLYFFTFVEIFEAPSSNTMKFLWIKKTLDLLKPCVEKVKTILVLTNILIKVHLIWNHPRFVEEKQIFHLKYYFIIHLRTFYI